MYTYEFPKADNTADIIILRPALAGAVEVALIQRGNEPDEPFPNHWAFPGGFLDLEKDDELVDAAYRETWEELTIAPQQLGWLEQFRTYSRRMRDPREKLPGRTRIISTVFIAVVPGDTVLEHADDAVNAQWADAVKVPEMELAFDHRRIWDDFIGSKIAPPCREGGYGLEAYVQRRLVARRGAI